MARHGRTWALDLSSAGYREVLSPSCSGGSDFVFIGTHGTPWTLSPPLVAAVLIALKHAQ